MGDFRDVEKEVLRYPFSALSSCRDGEESCHCVRSERGSKQHRLREALIEDVHIGVIDVPVADVVTGESAQQSSGGCHDLDKHCAALRFKQVEPGDQSAGRRENSDDCHADHERQNITRDRGGNEDAVEYASDKRGYGRYRQAHEDAHAKDRTRGFDDAGFVEEAFLIDVGHLFTAWRAALM